MPKKRFKPIFINVGETAQLVTGKTSLYRHGKREGHGWPWKTLHKANLTQEGRELMRQEGTTISPEFELYFTHSGLPRTRDTAQHLIEGHEAHTGKKVRKRKMSIVKGMQLPHRSNEGFDRMEALFQQRHQEMGGTPEMAKPALLSHIREWMDGKLPTQYVRHPVHYADETIRRVFGKGSKWSQTKPGRHLIAVGHDVTILAIMERLTGKKWENIGDIQPKEGEALHAYHTKNGKTILDYKGKTYDVTEKLAEIMKPTQKKRQKKK